MEIGERLGVSEGRWKAYEAVIGEFAGRADEEVRRVVGILGSNSSSSGNQGGISNQGSGNNTISI